MKNRIRLRIRICFGSVRALRKIRKQFSLSDFTAQLFIHAIGVAGHDIVK